jgi:transposase
MRATRDLLRRRRSLVRQRGQLLAHLQNTHHQHNLPEPSRKIIYRATRAGIPEKFTDPSIRKSIEADLALVEVYDRLIRELELHIVRTGTAHDPDSFLRLRSLPGVGKILALTIRSEIHDIRRFPSVQDFAASARLVTCAQASAGKRLGTGGRTIGNVHRTWAFSEAAVLCLRQHPTGQGLFQKLQRKPGKGKALSILAHTRGRVPSPRLARSTAFTMEQCMAA